MTDILHDLSEVDPLLHIDATYARNAVSRTPGDMKTKLFAAWETVSQESMNSNRWGAAWYDYLFRAGLSGLFLVLHATGETNTLDHLKFELNQIRRMSAIFSASRLGMAMSLESVLEDSEAQAEKYPPIGLLGWFREWKAQNKLMERPEYKKAARLAKELVEHCATHKITGTFSGIQIVDPTPGISKE